MKDLNDAMSMAEVPGIKGEVTGLLLLGGEDEAETAPSFSASPTTLVKEEKYSVEALVGDAKGLSGRLCSKLHHFAKVYMNRSK